MQAGWTLRVSLAPPRVESPAMSDDDEVPPLSGMQQQVGALRGRHTQQCSTLAGGRDDDAGLPVATATVVSEPVGASAGKAAARGANNKAGTIKRGFFDSPKSMPKPKPKLKQAETEEVPFIRASKAESSGRKQIPDFMRVDPSEQEKQFEQMKEGLLSALKPTEDMVQKVMGNPNLVAGFDDPEVMAAVDEIAKNPQALKKYQHNSKVQKFYQEMGMFVGSKLETMGSDGQPAAPPRGNK